MDITSLSFFILGISVALLAWVGQSQAKVIIDLKLRVRVLEAMQDRLREKVFRPKVDKPRTGG